MCVPCMLTASNVRGGEGFLGAKAVWWLHTCTPNSSVSEILGILWTFGGYYWAMWRILKADDTLYVRASGVDCDFHVAIYGTSFLRRKKHQKKKR